MDYRQKKFVKQAKEIITNFKLTKTKRVLDYGCAIGGLVYELKKQGLKNVSGTDISDWAIEYGMSIYPDVNLQYYNRNLLSKKYDLIICLDVLEHINSDELFRIVKLLGRSETNKILVRMPVSIKEGEDFVLEVSKNDKTHVQVHSKEWWIDLFLNSGFNCFQPVKLETIYDSEGVLAGVFTK